MIKTHKTSVQSEIDRGRALQHTFINNNTSQQNTHTNTTYLMN